MRDESSLEEAHKILGDTEESQLTEVFAVPDTMKQEFYYLLRGMGQMKMQGGSKSGQYGGQRRQNDNHRGGGGGGQYKSSFMKGRGNDYNRR